MAELTVEQRLGQLERFIYDGVFHMLDESDGCGGNVELRLTKCPSCGHRTIQIRDGISRTCLTCGHKLAYRIVAID
jgi:hypothetical protein